VIVPETIVKNLYVAVIRLILQEDLLYVKNKIS